MGLFSNPLGHAGYPPNVTGTPTTQPASIRAATAAEAAQGTLDNVYISPLTAQSATSLDFASPPVLGFGSTTPRPVHATTLDSTLNTLLATSASSTAVAIANVAPTAARTGDYHGGNSAQNDTVTWLGGNPSANTQSFSVLGGTATGGTQTLNLGNGIGGALTVNIANGATTTNTTLNIMSGVGVTGANTANLLNNPRITTIGFSDVAPSAARTTRFNGGNSAQNDVVSWFSGDPSANTQSFSIFTGAPSGGTQTVGIFTGNASGGTQAFNLLTGTNPATANICTGAAAHTLNLLSATGLLGCFGAPAVVQQAQGAITNSVTVGGTTGTIADFTDLTTYANDAATIRNDIYQLALALDGVITGLRNYGILG